MRDLIPRLIAKEEIAALPIRRYEGDVNLVASAAELERAMEDIRAEGVTGFDTETRNFPPSRKGESYLPCLIQVATARKVYLFQLSRLDFSAAAAELLGSQGDRQDGRRAEVRSRPVEAALSRSRRPPCSTSARWRSRHGLEQSGVAQPRRDLPGASGF